MKIETETPAWVTSLRVAVKSIPESVKMTEIAEVVRQQRIADVYPVEYCACGLKLMPSRRRTGPGRCSACVRSDRDSREAQRAAEKYRFEKQRFYSGGGTPAFRFRFLCDTTTKDVVQALQAMPYREFLQTPYWKIVSAYVRYRAARKCSVCAVEQSATIPVDVHHKSYENHGYEHRHLEDLTLLCRRCHSKFHDKLAVVA